MILILDSFGSMKSFLGVNSLTKGVGVELLICGFGLTKVVEGMLPYGMFGFLVGAFPSSAMLKLEPSCKSSTELKVIFDLLGLLKKKS